MQGSFGGDETEKHATYSSWVPCPYPLPRVPHVVEPSVAQISSRSQTYRHRLGGSCSRAQFGTSRCPPAVASARAVPRAVVLLRPHWHLWWPRAAVQSLSILAPGECDFVSNHRWLSPPVLVGTQAPAAARIALLVLASMVRVVMSIPQHPPRAQTSEERLDSPGDRRRCVAFSWPLPWRCRKGARGSSYNPYFIPCSVDPCSCSPHTLPFTPLRGPCEH